MRIAIYGAGSLGVILGAYLSKAGVDVELVNHHSAHVEALNKNGARVTGAVDMTVPVRAVLPGEMKGEYDYIFLLTKQLQNKSVAESLLSHLGSGGMICTFQNGLPELSLAEAVGEERVMGCVVGWGATLLEPGVSELTSDPAELSFDIGRMDGRVDGKVREAAEVLSKMCPVHIQENFMGVRWSKLLINAAFSGMSAVLGCTFGEAAEDKIARKCVQRIMKECIDAARADGKKIEPVQGKDIVKLFDYKGKLKEKISFMLIPLGIRAHRNLKASMLQDLEKGKKTEVDAINGVVSQVGRKVGVPTPFCDKVVELVHGIEEGRYTYEFGNLKYFSELL